MNKNEMREEINRLNNILSKKKNKDENLSFRKLTIALLNIIANGTTLAESASWNNYARLKSLEEAKTESDLFSLRSDVVNYREKLRFYVDNEKYQNDISLTNKFFTEVVSTVRKRAEKSLKVLSKTAESTKNVEEKQCLLDDIELLKVTTNLYLESVRNILDDNEKIQRYLGVFGIDYVTKYDLSDLD